MKLWLVQEDKLKSVRGHLTRIQTLASQTPKSFEKVSHWFHAQQLWLSIIGSNLPDSYQDTLLEIFHRSAKRSFIQTNREIDWSETLEFTTSSRSISFRWFFAVLREAGRIVLWFLINAELTPMSYLYNTWRKFQDKFKKKNLIDGVNNKRTQFFKPRYCNNQISKNNCDIEVRFVNIGLRILVVIAYYWVSIFWWFCKELNNRKEHANWKLHIAYSRILGMQSASACFYLVFLNFTNSCSMKYINQCWLPHRQRFFKLSCRIIVNILIIKIKCSINLHQI